MSDQESFNQTIKNVGSIINDIIDGGHYQQQNLDRGRQMSQDTHDIRVIRKRTLLDEFDEADLEYLDKITEFLVKEFQEGGIDQLRDSLHDAFDLDSEGVIAVLSCLGVLEHTATQATFKSISKEIDTAVKSAKE